MLIYCCRISLVPSSPESDLLSAVGDWLAGKIREPFPVGTLQVDGQKRLSGHNAEWLGVDHGGKRWWAMRYSHPDRATKGREWLTEVGVCRKPGSFECSVLLQTRESSALVDPTVETTRPKLVEDIFARCHIASDTVGGKPQPLRVQDADGFLYEVSNPERNYPIIQISYDADGGYLVEPSRLASQLAGVANVVFIPADVDTFALEDALGGRYSCYHGAVNVIWPRSRLLRDEAAPILRIMAHQIESVLARGKRPESLLLAFVCHRMNDLYFQTHVSPEMVQAAKHRAALEEALRSAAKPDPEMTELLKLVDKDQRGEISQLKSERDDLIAERNEARDHVRLLEGEVESLKANLAKMTQRAPATVASGQAERMRTLVREIASSDFSLELCLRVLTDLYPERLVVLDSAWKSAREAAAFRDPRRAFGLLDKLCTDYYQCLVKSTGDTEARSVFGNAYSARESETVEANKRARKLRTFQYKGKPVEMMAHLRIGVKDSLAETWRAHFLWDPDAQKIVIGHCGKHLDHR